MKLFVHLLFRIFDGVEGQLRGLLQLLDLIFYGVHIGGGALEQDFELVDAGLVVLEALLKAADQLLELLEFLAPIRHAFFRLGKLLFQDLYFVGTLLKPFLFGVELVQCLLLLPEVDAIEFLDL